MNLAGRLGISYFIVGIFITSLMVDVVSGRRLKIDPAQQWPM